MIRIAAAVFALLGIAAPVHAETLLQIDYGWRGDGERACSIPAFIEGAPWRRMACVNPTGELETFAQTMDTQFSSNPSCHGITLFRFPWGPDFNKSLEIYKRPHWLFFIFAYAPGDEKQSWKLTDPDRKSVFAGEGTPQEIVQEVCGVVAGKGGSLVR